MGQRAIYRNTAVHYSMPIRRTTLCMPAMWHSSYFIGLDARAAGLTAAHLSGVSAVQRHEPSAYPRAIYMNALRLECLAWLCVCVWGGGD
jgi:hypothetical protein